MIGSYFCSWSSKWASKKEDVDIKDVESDIIYISFAKPDCQYTSNSFENTGLTFSSDFEIVADAVKDLSETKTVMLSVGGGTYHGWDNLNVESLISLADDLHCKGIDIDWEPEDGASSSDKMAIIIDAFRSQYTGYLSFATAHVGAYGHGPFINSQPASIYTGCNYPGLIQSGDKLDWINVMAYDAGPTFNPLECYDSYKAIFSKKIYMGIEIGDQAWGGVITTLDQVQTLYNHIKDQGDNLFVWSWLKPGPITFQQIAQISSVPSIIIHEPTEPIIDSPTKRPIESVDSPTVQPSKEDFPEQLPTPELPPFIPTLPTIQPGEGKAIWQPGLRLKVNDLVFFQNATYKCRAPHSTLSGWEPNVALALFTLVKDPLKEDWIPQMEYSTGEKVLHKGKVYTCVAGHVSQTDWEPGMVGLWE